MAGDEALRVERVGDTVRRPMAHWSPAVHGLLRHLEAVDFPAPRLLDADGDVEILTWIDGDSGADGWAHVVPEDGVRAYARLLRRYHEAVRNYRPPADAVWSRGPGTGFVCHGDPGPWNVVFRAGEPFAFIDFDHAHVGAPLDDVTYALEFVAPFRTDEECLRDLRYDAPPQRGRRTEIFCEAYGIDVPADVRGLVADRQERDAALVEELARLGIHPQVTWVRDGVTDADRARAAWTRSVRLD